MSVSKKPDYEEFNNPRIAALYDIICPLGVDSEFFINTIKSLGVSDVVDLGCGSGIFTSKLSRLGYKMIGIEPSAPMLDIAKSRKLLDTSTQYLLGSCDQLEGVSTDMILMTSHVAQFFLSDGDWQGMLRSAYSALRSGGYLLFDSRNPLDMIWNRWSKENTFKEYLDSDHGDFETWTTLLEASDNSALYELHYRFKSTGEELISTNKLIYRSHAEIVHALNQQGFEVVKVCGDWGGSSYSDACEEMIFLAQKK